MPGWLHNLVTCDAFAIFAGAFLGALFGYFATRYFDWQETRVRRDQLTALLHEEYELINNELSPFDPRIWEYFDPVDIRAPSLLLDGNTLTYYSDSHLIRVLEVLRKVVNQYNAYVGTINASAYDPNLSLATRQTMHQTVVNKLSLVMLAISTVDQLIAQIERERQERWWLRIWAKVWPWYRPKMVIDVERLDASIQAAMKEAENKSKVPPTDSG